MKYAYVDGQRKEPSPKIRGTCINCNSEVISRCGNIKIWHWAHKAKVNCDPWWENETKWHRDWKNHFPNECQEVVHKDEATGEKHIADVKNRHNWVIEFQHSYLNDEEMKARSRYFDSIVWVVDGLRNKGFQSKFEKLLKGGKVLSRTPYICRIDATKSKVIREWSKVNKLVLFDFDEESELFLLQKDKNDNFYTIEIGKDYFIKISNDLKKDGLTSFTEEIKELLTEISNLKRVPPRGFLPKLKHKKIFSLNKEPKGHQSTS